MVVYGGLRSGDGIVVLRMRMRVDGEPGELGEDSPAR